MQIRTDRLSEAALLKITKAPGAQYILVNASDILEERYAGYADLVAGTPVTEKTTFNAFSITKTATAAAIMQLAERGKIVLSDYVNPMFNEFHFEYPFTLRQLVAHQAGFPDPLPISWIHLPGEDDQFDQNHFINRIVDKYSKQKFIPGTKFS